MRSGSVPHKSRAAYCPAAIALTALTVCELALISPIVAIGSIFSPWYSRASKGCQSAWHIPKNETSNAC